MNERMKSSRSRREFLKMIGRAGVGAGLAAAAPLGAGLLGTRRALAQGGSVRRVVFVYTPDGAPRGLWLPTGGALNLATQAFAGLQDLCHFREVSIVASGHGNARKSLGELRWSNDWSADTIDQQIASVLGEGTPYDSYVLGVQTNSEDHIVRRAGAAVPGQNDPAAAYEQLFGGAPPAGDSDGFLARRQSAMDVNREALVAMQDRLGAEERTLLARHGAALDELEARLRASAVPVDEACAAPAWNSRGYATGGGTEVPFLHTAELQADVIVAAMQCGLTHVMTLQLGWHQGVWYGHDTSYRGDHHGSCHSAPAADNAEMTNYLGRAIAYLVRRLMTEDDPAAPGTKMIDNTVVVQVTDMGDGQDHSGDAGPSLVATRMPSFAVGRVTRGGNNLEVLETVALGLGLGGELGTDLGAHRIWPCAGGNSIPDLLA